MRDCMFISSEQNQIFHLPIIRQPDFIYVETENKTFALNSAPEEFRLQDVTVFCQEQKNGLTISLQAEQSLVRFVTLRWCMTIPPKTRIMGDALERSYGDLEWRGMVPERYFPWYFLITNGFHTIGCGVKTAPSALCYWQADDSGVTLCLDVRNGDMGVFLNGRCLEAAEIVMEECDEIRPYEAAVRLCKKMCKNSLLPAKPVYGINDWYYAYGTSSRESILRDTKLLMSLSPNDGNPPYAVIDDGWQQTYAPGMDNDGGPWSEANERFLDMKTLAQDIKKLGAIPGIWFRPLLHQKQDLPKEMYLKNRSGRLDISNPKVLTQIAKDVHRFNDWGYRLIKYDFTTYDIFGKWGFHLAPKSSLNGLRFQDNTKTNAELIRKLYETIYHAATPDTIILGCNCIGHLGVGTMHVYRTGDDTSGKNWERTRKMGVNTLAFRLPQHNIFYAVDADCIGMTGNIPWDLNKEWLRLLQNSGTPLFVSADSNTITIEQQEDLRAAYQQASKQTNSLEPIDWLHTTCPTKWMVNGIITQFHWFENTGLSITSPCE